MRKTLLTLAAFICVAVAAMAQSRAIGGRIGYGIDFSYEHTLGSNMLSIEVGAPGYRGITGAVTHDWIFPITAWEEEGEWNWYAGVGGAIGSLWNYHYNYPYHGPRDHYNVTYFGVAGRIGVEYNFWFPLQLSLDWRPVFGPAFHNVNGRYINTYFSTEALYEGGIALGVRYRF